MATGLRAPPGPDPENDLARLTTRCDSRTRLGPACSRDAGPSHIAFSYVLLFNLPLTLPMRQSASARSWCPRHSCYFARRPPRLRGRATNRLLPPAEGLDRKPAIALTVINLGLLSSDAHALHLSKRDGLDLAAPFGGIGRAALEAQDCACLWPEPENHILLEHFANVHKQASDHLESDN